MVPFAAGAQSVDLSKIQQSLPGPVNDLVNLVQKVKIDAPNANLTSGSNGGIDINLGQLGQSGVSGDLGSIWQSANNWVSSHVGISLNDIVKAILNIVIWIWQFLIGLLKDLVSHL